MPLTIRDPIQYLNRILESDDRLALVLVRKDKNVENDGTGPQNQTRICTVSQVMDKYLSWLRFMNLHKYEIYASANPLEANAIRRTKSDVRQIRHVYLDFDEHGIEAYRRFIGSAQVPSPNWTIATSPGKLQALWRVSDFDPEQAESLMRNLARAAGADTAATDRNRVLRVPGLYNHKYERPHFVIAAQAHSAIFTPRDFATIPPPGPAASNPHTHRANPTRQKSQSERDMSAVLQRLRRHEEPHAIIAWLAARRPDKPNPRYYAEHTVANAVRFYNQLHPNAHLAL